mmetsp:Transcript_17922/g.50772  ORF Transcript_17922/g.50772 Transcript_17922/m.50772 type:complete len:383 (+) Transcript_17922:714-1862(+)
MMLLWPSMSMMRGSTSGAACAAWPAPAPAGAPAACGGHSGPVATACGVATGRGTSPAGAPSGWAPSCMRCLFSRALFLFSSMTASCSALSLCVATASSRWTAGGGGTRAPGLPEAAVSLGAAWLSSSSSPTSMMQSQTLPAFSAPPPLASMSTQSQSSPALAAASPLGSSTSMPSRALLAFAACSCDLLLACARRDWNSSRRLEESQEAARWDSSCSFAGAVLSFQFHWYPAAKAARCIHSAREHPVRSSRNDLHQASAFSSASDQLLISFPRTPPKATSFMRRGYLASSRSLRVVVLPGLKACLASGSSIFHLRLASGSLKMSPSRPRTSRGMACGEEAAHRSLFSRWEWSPGSLQCLATRHRTSFSRGRMPVKAHSHRWS